MLSEAFLQQGSFWHWLLYSDHIVNQTVNTVWGAVLGVVVVGMLIRPRLQKLAAVVSKEWAEHKRLLGAREQLCPVCAGRGTVNKGFYPGMSGSYAFRTDEASVQCRRCGGAGTITVSGSGA